MPTSASDSISILLIEDNPGDARLIQEMLGEARPATFKLERVDRLASGIDHLQRDRQVDVVLTDLGLPDSQGWNTFARVRATVPDVPIIVLTGLDDEATALKAIGEGAQDYLIKGQVQGYLLPRAIRYAIERKRSEAERATLLARLRAQADQVVRILDTIPVGVIMLDGDGRILSVNPMAAQLPPGLFACAIGVRADRFGDLSFQQLIAAPMLASWQEITVDGHVFLVMARPVSGDEGGSLGEWVVVVDDVTEQRSVQDQLHRQERLAAVGQLAAGIAHDFNNILSIINIQTALAAETAALSPRVRDRLAVIGQQINLAITLIQQILDFGRRAVLDRQPIDLRTVLETQVTLLKRILPENIGIELSSEPGEYVITADPTRIQQMVMNLAVNARDAMPSGRSFHIALAASGDRPHEHMSEGAWFRLEIADSGTGVTSEILPHLFEPFFTTKPRGHGTGLGLAQVYGIVKQHGGEIDVQSVVGQGTTFTIYLPATSQTVIDVSHEESPDDHFGHGESILLVEDNDLLLEAMSELLEMLGYTTLHARNGQEALAVLEATVGPVDLILTDLVMPVMGGDALLLELRRRGVDIPVVILSGHPLTRELDRLTASGMAGWLLKPASRDDLSRVISGALGRR
ncbi:MAG: response regulator [Caldilinea sp.]|nr:response regulator [Caldilineaceae bacterium]MCB9118802.1 response regulator [Caldilineaceae bacterium]MCB9125008.1 response regulator [Caldilineaceae bacterium]MCO5213179.1 response regulator [Caldilinea sp.]MCW5844970.1 response regulator [Caldilinea sp.]